MAGVFSLRPATSYHFRIVAQNEIGGSSPSDTVTIETAEEAPGGPPVDIRVAAVDQHTLRYFLRQHQILLSRSWHKIKIYNINKIKVHTCPTFYSMLCRSEWKNSLIIRIFGK
jgi:hypothetical protein